MDYIQLFRNYLLAYSEMDLEKVSSMFASTIHLRDWKVSVYGKEAAVEETKKNFDASSAIKIEILHVYSFSQSVAGELRITVDDSEILYVLDVVTFNKSGLITSIRAYVGRGD